MEENLLSSYSSEENYNVYIAAALALNKDDFLKKFIKKITEKKVEFENFLLCLLFLLKGKVMLV